MHSAAFIKAGVSQKNIKDKRFGMKRKHWDKKLQRHNKTNRKTIAGMLTSRLVAFRSTKNGMRRRDTRAFNRKGAQALPLHATKTMQHVLQAF
jgi:hypothetical protein